MTRSRPVVPITMPSSELEAAIKERYARGAVVAEPGLCCPSASYDPRLLELLPKEIIEKDYGCGDPSQHVRPGEVVVDLGSGAGKVCYILAQKVGAAGRVIGLDFNDSMLALARRHRDDVADRLGFCNVEFRKARIQDLALDLDAAESWLARHPASSLEELAAFETHCQRLRREAPLVRDESVDVVVSNCVLNLVRPEDKHRLFRELYRVLRRGGRAVISDIVCDEDPTPTILNDQALWSGCIAGAFREDRFLEMFEEAGFHGIEILSRGDTPWQVLDGIEFRSLTVRAFKGKQGPCLERNQAVIYKGPWKQVIDDDGHVLRRGQRMAVCDKTFRLLTDAAGPYALQVAPVLPRDEVPLDQAGPFECHGSALRPARQTKGQDYCETRTGDIGAACSPDGHCC
jgi:SAM-dependent methyltransferase